MTLVLSWRERRRLPLVFAREAATSHHVSAGLVLQSVQTDRGLDAGRRYSCNMRLSQQVDPTMARNNSLFKMSSTESTVRQQRSLLPARSTLL